MKIKYAASLIELFTADQQPMATIEYQGNIGMFDVKGIEYLIQSNAKEHDVGDLLNIHKLMKDSNIDDLPEMDRDMVTGQGNLF